MILQGDSRQKANRMKLPLNNFKPISIVFFTDRRNQCMNSGGLNLKATYAVHSPVCL